MPAYPPNRSDYISFLTLITKAVPVLMINTTRNDKGNQNNGVKVPVPGKGEVFLSPPR
jgi:hypothetical protein